VSCLKKVLHAWLKNGTYKKLEELKEEEIWYFLDRPGADSFALGKKLYLMKLILFSSVGKSLDCATPSEFDDQPLMGRAHTTGENRKWGETKQRSENQV
jgi:hypothetical protein